MADHSLFELRTDLGSIIGHGVQWMDGSVTVRIFDPSNTNYMMDAEPINVGEIGTLRELYSRTDVHVAYL